MEGVLQFPLLHSVVGRERELQIPRLRSPGFPVKLVGVGEPHAAFLTESRTGSRGWSHVQEIRVGMTKWRVAAWVRAESGMDGTAGPSTPLRSGRDDNFV
jgi:hypothetical protein